MKILKYTVVSIGILILTVFGLGVYFAGQLSTTYPPIETYTLNTAEKEFVTVLKKIGNKGKYEITFTDTTGLNIDSEYSYYFNILNLTTNDKYLLKFESDKTLLGTDKIKLNLIGLVNVQRKHVIYEPDDESEVVKVKFESELLEKIKN